MSNKQLDIFEEQPLVRIDVNLPKVRQALQSFANDRRQALVRFSNEVRDAVADGVNQLLNAEMSIFLGQPGQETNKRNGYRSRDYTLKGVGTLRVHVPRDRDGEFSSVVIPQHERLDPRLREDMAMLHLAGVSNRTLAMMSRRVLGLDVSKDTISSSLSLVKDAANQWLTRPIHEEHWALYIDGTNFKIQRRGSTEREPSLVVLGVTDSNYRSVLAIEPGHRDNVESWRAVFRSLKSRGLNGSRIRIGVMDGLPGLEKLFLEEFPSAVTQRCWLHAKRNAMAKAPARLRDAFRVLLEKVMYATSENSARVALDQLRQSMGTDAKRAVDCIVKDIDSLIRHYQFEQRFWVALRTTNPIERLNKEFKRRTKTMETLGEETLMAVVTFTAIRMEMGWRRTPIDSKAMWNLKPLKERKELEANDVENAFEKMSEELH